MRHPLRDRFAAYIAAHEFGVLSLAGAEGAWALPVRYRSRELLIACLVPRWAEAAFYLERDAEALLVIPDDRAADRRWLACRGRAEVGAADTWPGPLPGHPGATDRSALHEVVHLRPAHLDLIDEGAGWGRRENLDLAWGP